jgi:hypothetical protein
MQNLIICFPSGAGGHFIANLCCFLLHKKINKIDATGSYHNHSNNYISHVDDIPLDLISLDLTPYSYQQEYNLIQAVPAYPSIILGHLRNLKLLQELGKKVIFISFLEQHKIEIKRRLHRKISNKSINKIRYEILAGADWPSWEEYVNGAAVEELDPNGLGITGKNDLDDWYYIMPVNTKNMFEIKFEDIVSTGYGFVDGLAHFLNVTEFDKPKIYAIIDEYRSNQ